MRDSQQFTRRELVQWLSALTFGGGAVAPGCSSSDASSSPPANSDTDGGDAGANLATDAGPPGFLSDAQHRALSALADGILPPDDAPGGAALGVVAYVEKLLTALDGPGIPAIYAGGPFSGRTPFGDNHGAASGNVPPNDFVNFLPLGRVALAGWRLALYGSNGVPGGGPNDAVTGPIIGLRDQVKNGLDAVIAANATALEQMSADQIAQVIAHMDADFRGLLIELVAQAAFSAPEYGGNPSGAGWRMVNVDGDTQPLGYSIWDEAAGTMRERADKPVSTADPGPDPMPLDDATRALLKTISQITGGKAF